MMQQYYIMNDFVSPKKERINQSLEWQLYLKSEFRNRSKQSKSFRKIEKL
ncbi:hypothetical protein [Fusibacter ferrireducens]|nr:hypothetical protein [Fusibacter ferrireducens]